MSLHSGAAEQPWPRRGRYAAAPVIDGYFAPLAIAPTPFEGWLRQELTSLAWPPEVAVYLRGSRLEEEAPFPEADLDLMVVADSVPERLASWATLNAWAAQHPWHVDGTAWSPREVEHCGALRLLLTTRARLLVGPAAAFSPVAANEATMRDHARRLGVWKLPARLSPRLVRRVCELKQATRAFGVWRFCAGGPFSRDLATCLDYADVLAPDAGARLRQAWCAVNSGSELDIAVALEAFRGCPLLWR